MSTQITSNITDKYTRQEILDISCRQIIGQNYQRSVSDEGECLYHGPNGVKCAAGPFVRDSVRRGPSVAHRDDVAYIIPLVGVADVDRELLWNLQHAHDVALERGRDSWECSIREIAMLNGLSADVLAEGLD